MVVEPVVTVFFHGIYEIAEIALANFGPNSIIFFKK